MLRVERAARQLQRRDGSICWQCCVKLAKRQHFTRPWTVHVLSQDTFEPSTPDAQHERKRLGFRRIQSRSVQRTESEYTKSEYTESEHRKSENRKLERCSPIRKLGSNVSNVRSSNASSWKEHQRSISQPSLVFVGENGQYTKLRRPSTTTSRSVSEPAPKVDPLRHTIDQRLQNQSDINTRQSSYTLQSQGLSTRRPTFENDSSKSELSPVRIRSYVSNSTYQGPSSVPVSVRPRPNDPSPIPHGPSGFSLRTFSTSTRSLRSSMVAAHEAPQDLPFIPNPSYTLDSPIRAKLQRFQQALDDASEDKKAALGVAFSKFTVGPNFAGKGIDEKNEADDQDPDDSFNAHAAPTGQFLEPGDLIEVPVQNKLCLGLVTAVFPMSKTNRDAQTQIVTSLGPWLHKAYKTISLPWFIIKRFADPTEYELLKSYLPNSALPVEMLDKWNSNQWYVPVEVSCSITEKLQTFQMAADEIYRSQASRLDNAFELVANPSHTIYLTLEEIARKVLRIDSLSTVSLEQMYAVHKACVLYHPAMLAEEMHGLSQTFEILSKRDAELIEQVRRWVREHSEKNVNLVNNSNSTQTQSVLEVFASEVRPIIKKSRKNREQLITGHLGPSVRQLKALTDQSTSYQIISGTSISASTSLILKFLRLWSGQFRSKAANRLLSALGAAILKSTDLYHVDKTFGFEVSLTLLKECGIVAPWSNITEDSGRFSDPVLGDSVHNKQLLAGISEEREEGLLKVDTMKDFRRDWGDTPVFCIDSADTTVVDDGISLEKAPEPDTYWIHAHIANPSAFVSPESKIAQFAQQQLTSIYLPDRVNDMMPDGIGQEMSLAKGKRCPVLTVSTKLNLDGMILDRQIQNGYINNILHITPRDLNHYVGITEDNESVSKLYSVGRIPIPEVQHEQLEKSLSDEHTTALRMLNRLGKTWWKHNCSAWNRKWFAQDVTIAATPKVYHTHFESSDFGKFRQFVGDPTITLSTPIWEPRLARRFLPQQNDYDTVALCMIISNYTAAIWCAQRGVPAVFRGSTYAADTDLNVVASQPIEKPSGIAADFKKFMERQEVLFARQFSLSTRITPHKLLPLEGYMQVTSPLRRFDDIANHWQIEAALREEAKLGRILTEFDVMKYPFPEDGLAQFLVNRFSLLLHSKKRTYAAARHWLVQFMVRGSYFGECHNLPDLYTLYIIKSEPDRFQGIIAEIRYIANITRWSKVWQTKEAKFPIAGEVWKVRLAKESFLEQKLEWQPVERIA